MKRKNLLTDIDQMSGIEFHITEEIAVRLRDEAVISALEAETKKDAWVRAVISLARVKLSKKFGPFWDRSIGLMKFSDRSITVKIVRIEEPGWRESDPVLVYRTKLKSGKWSTSEAEVKVSYALSFFSITPENKT